MRGEHYIGHSYRKKKSGTQLKCVRKPFVNDESRFHVTQLTLLISGMLTSAVTSFITKFLESQFAVSSTYAAGILGELFSCLVFFFVHAKTSYFIIISHMLEE